MRHCRSVFVLISLLFAATTASAEVAITISGSTVVATGITAHGNAAFFGVMRGQSGSRGAVTYVDQVLADSDGDGVVTLTVQSAVPFRSVFAVVDQTSGGYAVKTPNGFPVLPLLEDGSQPLVMVDGQRQISVQKSQVQMLLVRPGVGVWNRLLSDGRPADGDGLADGKVVGLAAGSTVEYGSSSLDGFLDGDILVLIDGYFVSVYAARIGAVAQ